MASIYGGSGNELFYHGSGHLKTAARDLVPPHGKVIVAIQVLNTAVFFSKLVADTSGASNVVDQTSPVDTRGDGIAYFGTEAQTRANGLDQSNSSVESEVVADTVGFPAGITVYGRWTRVSLESNSVHGIIVYYGPQ
tara:strand:- start:1068 stop:1478 length:411 start_codon:yes stop_codon:yes gene_type:complete